MKCPCCGGEVDEVPIDALNDIQMSAVGRTILRQLQAVYPSGVSKTKLIFEIYGMRDNQPDTAPNVVTIAVGRLRKHIEPHGWTIPANQGGKEVGAVYRLERL